MPRTFEETINDGEKLRSLVPDYADQPHVVTSAEIMHKRGETGALRKDRRVGAHILRLERHAERRGFEARLWDMAVSELVIKDEDIPDSYVQEVLRQRRDDGIIPDYATPDEQKQQVVVGLQNAQRESAREWRNHLEQAGEEYPVWFKLYVWEGMSRLGKFDMSKKRFKHRSKSTVAQYPPLDSSILKEVYETAIDQSGAESFNSLYSRLLVEHKKPVPTPDSADEVDGEWLTYTHKDVNELIGASFLTPWCVANRIDAEEYLANGDTFHMYHLRDPELGTLSSTACASVRVNRLNDVAEISGLEDGGLQHVEDALKPTVEKKLEELPNGEYFVTARMDRERLITMDKKLEKQEPFSVEELMFLYEVERPIYNLNPEEARPISFRRHRAEHIYQLTEMLGNKAHAMFIVFGINTDVTAHEDIEIFYRDGGETSFLLKYLKPNMVLWGIDALRDHGVAVEIEAVEAQLSAVEKLEGFDILKTNGSPITLETILSELTPVEKLWYFETMLDKGSTMSAEEVVAALSDDERVEYGPDVEDLIGLYGEAAQT